jgi:hypothetical protein
MDGVDLLAESQAALTDADRKAFDKLMGRLQYSTQVLLLLSEWLDEQEDGKGSRLILGFVDTFAEHEAEDLG